MILDQTVFDVAMLLLRVVAGPTMAAHGVNHILGGGKIAGTGRWFSSIGMRHGLAQAWIASVTEIGAGFLMLAGLLTPLASAGYVGVMTVAIVTVHFRNGFFIIKEGVEYALTIITYAIVIAMLGPGSFSLDRVLGLDVLLDGWVGAAIAVGGGLVALLQLAVFWRPAGERA